MNLSEFPPFYTLQPNLDTKNKQLNLWKEYILQISLKNRLWILDYKIFKNSKINRSCSPEFINLIIEELVNSGIFSNFI